MVHAVRAINKNTGPCSVSFTLKVIFIMSIPNFNFVAITVGKEFTEHYLLRA